MIVFLLFFLSGAAGLILEAVFLRQLVWLAGSAVGATALVLASFMAGLAAGAAFFGTRADRMARPLRLYAILEIGAGIAGALVTWLLGSGREVMLGPLRVLGPGPLAFVILLVPTALMGGTLPAVARYVVRSRERLLGGLGLLYGINTLGGAAGVFVTGFVLFEKLGVSASGYLAAGIDVAIGLVALAISNRGVPATTESPATAATAWNPKKTVCLIAAGAGGFAVLGYEIAWTRLLSLPMRSYAYSFSLMLALFLLGIVLGSLALSALARRIERPLVWLGWVQVAMGLWVALSILWLPGLLAPPRGGSFLGFLFRSALVAIPVVVPPTLLSGMALPLAVRCIAGPASRVGRDVGRVYAVNTAGAIAGALVAGLVLLPAIGAPRTLVVLALLGAASGALVISVTAPRRRLVAAVLAIACVLPIARTGEPFLRGFLEASVGGDKVGDVLLFHEGTADTIAVVSKEYGFHDPEAKTLITNGISMAATVKPVWRYMAAEGHLPVLLADDPSRALVVCLGTGITLGAIASHPGVESIDAVELSDGVIRALPVFARENRSAHDDPRVRVVKQDGRHFLEMTDRRYGLITLEPPPPIVAGSAHLYSLDFYRLCSRRLTPGGIVAQWLPLHGQSLRSARMTARTFLDAFPHVQLWLPSIRDAVLVGSHEPIAMDLARVTRAYEEAKTKQSLDEAYLETPEALLGTFLLDRAGVERFVGDAPQTTDERPRMEFFREQGPNMTDREIASLMAIPQARWDWIEGDDVDTLRAKIEQENRALRLYVKSGIEQNAKQSIDAARLARGTDFYLYRLGCAPAQLRYLAQRNPDAWSEQNRLCRVRVPPRE